MNKSESIVKISTALVKAQKNIGAANKGAANPFFRSKYADLGSVMEACKEALNEQGISVLQPVVSSETGTFVETILLHESGEFISGSMKVVEGKNMQELGSGVSYARRYGLQSLVFIPAEDDDGESSVGRGKNAPKNPVEPKEVKSAGVTSKVEGTLTNVTTTSETPNTGDASAPKKRPSFRREATPASAVVSTPASTTNNTNNGLGF